FFAFFDKLFFTGIILLSLLERLFFANENYTLIHIYRIDVNLSLPVSYEWYKWGHDGKKKR
ncbi:MAG: hypothetical protein AB1442_12435, partial [Nitrospirota bacterium]